MQSGNVKACTGIKYTEIAREKHEGSCKETHEEALGRFDWESGWGAMATG